jgi:acyl carrier protein
MDAFLAGREIQAHLLKSFPNQGVELSFSTDLLGEYFLDSIAVIEMVDYLESRFSIRLARADINGRTFKNIDALSRFVAERYSG